MKFLKLLPFAFIFVGLNVIAQEASNTIEDQFTDVIDNSNRYQDYKVVKINKLNNLKKSVSDSIDVFQKEIENLEIEKASSQNTIDSLKIEMTKLNEALQLSKKKEEGILFFGTIIKKSVYNAIMWGVIAFLLLALIIFIMKFRRSNNITRQANEKLADTETELETHRRNSLEREQQLRRKLQDEINKQKKA